MVKGLSVLALGLDCLGLSNLSISRFSHSRGGKMSRDELLVCSLKEFTEFVGRGVSSRVLSLSFVLRCETSLHLSFLGTPAAEAGEV